MAGNPQVLGLLEEMLNSGKTPEEVCRDRPELLPEVRQRWQEFQLIDAQVRTLLPGLGTRPDTGTPAPPGPAPAPRSPSPCPGGTTRQGQPGLWPRCQQAARLGRGEEEECIPLCPSRFRVSCSSPILMCKKRRLCIRLVPGKKRPFSSSVRL